MTAGSSLSFARALKTNFLQTYRTPTTLYDAKLKSIMDLGMVSDGAMEDYFYYLSSPHPEFTEPNLGPTEKSFGGRAFRAVNRDWKLSVGWHDNMEQDDQTKSLVKQAREAGQNFRLLPERLFFQIIKAQSDSLLLPTIPTSADGSALYATTDGTGAARFGQTNGNLLSGFTLNSGADFRDAVYQAIEQFGFFKQTEDSQQPLYLEQYCERNGIMVIFGRALLKQAEEAFKQSQVGEIATSVGGTQNVGIAGVSNVIIDAGHKIELWPTQRITDSSIYVFIKNPETKAVFWQTRQALRDNIADFSNSDMTRKTDKKALYWKSRGTAHVHGDPYMTIKLTT